MKNKARGARPFGAPLQPPGRGAAHLTKDGVDQIRRIKASLSRRERDAPPYGGALGWTLEENTANSYLVSNGSGRGAFLHSTTITHSLHEHEKKLTTLVKPFQLMKKLDPWFVTEALLFIGGRPFGGARPEEKGPSSDYPKIFHIFGFLFIASEGVPPFSFISLLCWEINVKEGPRPWGLSPFSFLFFLTKKLKKKTYKWALQQLGGALRCRPSFSTVLRE
uniref:Uncharacterized protein n=1 Tax=Morchella importuna TaxID=1174673 RepID=A0A650AFF8_9PEZI|nr:hypothetical protein [Morchella importuna]QGN66770.1 hypothetical protein [Morchella importuna]